MNSIDCDICRTVVADDSDPLLQRALRKNAISVSDWEAVVGIALLHGGEEHEIRRIDESIEALLPRMGPATLRLSEHHFPVYCWEHREGKQAWQVKHV